MLVGQPVLSHKISGLDKVNQNRLTN